jgi:cellulose 1,4-beta-cellobiosidase
MAYILLAILASICLCYGQQVGTQTAETHPSLPIQKCSGSQSCTAESTKIVLDSNWRWTHTTSGYTNCYTGNLWDATLCPDAVTCAKNCAIDGADYSGTYGISTSGNALNIKFVTAGQYGKNIGSRVYLMQDDSTYKMFQLKNQEFTFDVDVSNLPCGLNGALYFVEMSADGGLSKYPGNKAGAKYGTGYCDAQCPHDLKWINGEANVAGWAPSPNDPNSGAGKYGTCCNEMDIWEANSQATAYTPHVCTVQGQTRCTGNECGDGENRYDGFCDKDGCDFNSYRLGDKTFIGAGSSFKVDTTKKFTVVTQFVTSDGTSSGPVSEIRRLYVQNGQVVQNSKVQVPGVNQYDSVTDQFCMDLKTAFNDKNDFAKKGGMKGMGDALGRGMVLVMSLWDDHEAHMLWLDSNYPTTVSPNTPGISRGACPTTSGVPADVESQHPNSNVIFSNIRYGDIGSTYPKSLSGAFEN